MHPPWIIFLFFLNVKNLMGTNLLGKSTSLQPGSENDLAPIKQRQTRTSEINLMPYQLYYIAPHKPNQNLDLRNGFFAFAPSESSDFSQNIDHHKNNPMKYLPEFRPNVLISSNVSTSKIQVAEFKPYSKSNDTKITIFPQKFKVSSTTPTLLKDSNEIPNSPAFMAPEQKKFVSNLIKMNQNNYFQASDVFFNDSPIKKLKPNEYEGATAVYRSHNFQDVSINKNKEFSFPNSKENQSNDKEKLPRLKVPQENEIRFMVNVPPLPIKNHLGNLLADKENYNERNRSLSRNKNPQLDVFLSILQETKNLPKNFTSDNLSSGIKTLALILQRLQEEKKAEETRSKQTSYVKLTSKTFNKMKSDVKNYEKNESFPQLSESSTPGKPGMDYPIYASIPNTKFDCSSQRYKGFFADPDTNCQVWHYCDLNGGQASFLCPNGTIFSQAALTCDWWFNVKCASTSQLYVLNERLYKYILPFAPSFPEDYSGPVVDKYLMAKFKEKENN